MKQNLMRAAAVGLGLALAWALLEGVIRVQQRAPRFRPRSVAIHEKNRAPGDRPHFRRSPWPNRSKQRFRLLVVGDSFTWGGGVYHNDTYGRRLESLLERMNRGLNVQLTLYSRPGWNTEQEVRALRRDIKRLDPDLILLGYCLNDAETRNREGLEDIREPLKRRRPTSAVGRWLFRNSRLAKLVWNRLENTRQAKAFRSYYVALYQREGWQASQDAFDELKELAREAEAPLVVAVFPIFDQEFDHGYSYQSLHRRVMGALRQRDITATDLLPAYRGTDTSRLAVHPFTDPHPNELAHRIASQHLADFLVEQELVPVTREQRDRVELSLRPRKRSKTKE